MYVNKNTDMQDLKTINSHFKQPEGPFDDWVGRKITEFKNSYPDIMIRYYYNSYLDSYLIHMQHSTKLSKYIERFISCTLLRQVVDSDTILYELTKMWEVLKANGRT